MDKLKYRLTLTFEKELDKEDVEYIKEALKDGIGQVLGETFGDIEEFKLYKFEEIKEE